MCLHRSDIGPGMRCGGSAQGAGVLPGGPGCGWMGGLGAAGMPGERDRSRIGLGGQLAQALDGQQQLSAVIE